MPLAFDDIAGDIIYHMPGIHIASSTKLPEVSMNIFNIFNVNYVQKFILAIFIFKKKINNIEIVVE